MVKKASIHFQNSDINFSKEKVGDRWSDICLKKNPKRWEVARHLDVFSPSKKCTF
jgi:hypothetical protein